jgi:hypothetical protein
MKTLIFMGLVAFCFLLVALAWKRVVKSYFNYQAIKEYKKYGEPRWMRKNGFVVRVDEKNERHVEEVQRIILPFEE